MRFEILQASGGQYYWRLVSANGEVIATSEHFYERAEARRSAESVKAQAGAAAVVEQ